MKTEKIISLFTFIMIISSSTLSAQEIFLTTGGIASGSGGIVNYSIGQVFYSSFKGTAYSTIQGIQQPFEISVVTGIEEAKGIILELAVYPNPTKDFINLKVGNYQIQNLQFFMIDMNGKLLLKKKITGNETIIPMNTLVPGVFFLKIIDDNKEIKTFKIIKN